jgi:hypothetical protein
MTAQQEKGSERYLEVRKMNTTTTDAAIEELRQVVVGADCVSE